ncbi:hypothetical protein RD110_18430 [Rhodoferax koreense]|uniref:Oxidoreductase molybdopterin-binding domain-containing protein n=2 Tax=Rhodoferax koreensis TaxID=1842727 RepID=A0A1P8K4E0_9BURK|nr:molybdopterin-dependent oxidoreductase [Rhodoferax koreense]APW40791.1 hypothetical protein RD110_18430 [Rhodoferax koreense]
MACGILLAAGQALALEAPADPVVLTISGPVTQANKGQDAVFDMKMLAKLPQKTFSTRTPWYPEAMSFTGPLLRDVLAAAGARGSKIVASALNDYKTEIPFDDALRQDAIVARLMNDQPMPVRGKGPLFIVYPYDSKSELRSEIYYNRSAWQLKALTVIP